MKPPFLIVREGTSFWVETGSAEGCSATLQAVREGCFREAWCYDASGGVWPIVEATLKQRPTFAQRLLPWKRLAVDLRLGPRTETDVAIVVSHLARILRSDSGFCESLQAPAADVLRDFESARTPADLIRIARKYE